MKRLRGEVQLLMLAVLAGVLLAVVGYIAGYERGHSAGVDHVQLEWDKKALEDARFAAEESTERDRRILEVQQQRVAAEQLAAKAQSDLEEVKREAHRKGVGLVACQGRPVARADDPAGRGVPGDDAGGARVPDRPLPTWEFVREFDAAWTGLDGKPLSDLAAGDGWAARAGTAAPYTFEDVIDVTEANAIRCSSDRRELAALIDKIRRAALAFDEVRR